MGTVLIQGGVHADARGILRFCNDFDLSGVKRFYTIRNSAAEPKRGWIMHKRETKWFFPVLGVTKVSVRLAGSGPSDVFTCVLDAALPEVLKIDPEQWFCIEQDGSAEVQVFSNCRVGEFADDDFRSPI